MAAVEITLLTGSLLLIGLLQHGPYPGPVCRGRVTAYDCASDSVAHDVTAFGEDLSDTAAVTHLNALAASVDRIPRARVYVVACFATSIC